jgi:hypothetical protein
VDGEAGILQDRIEILPLEGCRHDPRERVRSGQDEEQECDGDRGLHGEGVGTEARRDRLLRQSHDGAEQGEDQDPEEHRALMVSPNPGELVDERFRRVGILDHVENREIRRCVGHHECREGEANAGEHGQRRRPRHAHQHRIVAARAP